MNCERINYEFGVEKKSPVFDLISGILLPLFHCMRIKKSIFQPKVFHHIWVFCSVCVCVFFVLHLIHFKPDRLPLFLCKTRFFGRFSARYGLGLKFIIVLDKYKCNDKLIWVQVILSFYEIKNDGQNDDQKFQNENLKISQHSINGLCTRRMWRIYFSNVKLMDLSIQNKKTWIKYILFCFHSFENDRLSSLSNGF